MIFMLECQEIYFTSERGVFDDFSKITEDSSRLVRRSHERRQKFFENFRRLPKTFEFEGDPKMFPLYTSEFKYNLRDKLNTSEISDILGYFSLS